MAKDPVLSTLSFLRSLLWRGFDPWLSFVERERERERKEKKGKEKQKEKKDRKERGRKEGNQECPLWHSGLRT